MEWVFSSCGLGFRLYFFLNAFLLKRLQFCSKSEVTTNGENLDIFCSILLRFFVAISVWTEISKKWSFCFATMDIKSSRWKIWGVFWFVLWICLYLSDIGFSVIDWWASSMQHNFTSLDCASSAFLFVSGNRNCFWWLLKIDYAFFKFVCNVNWLLMFYSVQCKSSFLNGNTEAN